MGGGKRRRHATAHRPKQACVMRQESAGVATRHSPSRALTSARAHIQFRHLSRAAGVAQLVEHNLAKVGVAGSSPVSRSKNSTTYVLLVPTVRNPYGKPLQRF